MDRIIAILVNAAALWVAVQLTGLEYDFGPSDAWWKFLVVALIFSLVNTYLKPVLRILTLPITLVTLGLFLLVLNALLLYLVEAVAGQLSIPFDVPDFLAALLGSLVISIVGTVLSLVLGTGRMAGRVV